ncbi:MAG: flagellar biosynthesis protein [Gammaproteobacteria bacterium]|nr:flagellar biosynthesis protein [Gammaproteobacteria bacterium]
MQVRNLLSIMMLLVTIAIAGCATNRSEITLDSPGVLPVASAPLSGRTVFIRSVSDERVFEQAPGNPSVPSLGFGGADQATAEIKARAIGRKRNSFGKALGDVLLQNGQTVEEVVRENLAAALQQAGYQISSEATTDPSVLIIDVHIKQFWAWFKPGFWAITLNANISTDLDLSGAAAPITISVSAQDSRQLATESAWVEIVNKALNDYRMQVLGKAGEFPVAQ